ncbi:hypothetical protein BpHYR1_010994 [Brachionus plicatilis]|uniref:Uncharacterized protein n=1 Tax=Brachionus plicatilis TaxID=10195 RepID=A0A3M7PEF1_BRAPC|nr:hypothetical protein BpHYR1_010994 [Brachionus plicatilis]
MQVAWFLHGLGVQFTQTTKVTLGTNAYKSAADYTANPLILTDALIGTQVRKKGEEKEMEMFMSGVIDDVENT